MQTALESAENAISFWRARALGANVPEIRSLYLGFGYCHTLFEEVSWHLHALAAMLRVEVLGYEKLRLELRRAADDGGLRYRKQTQSTLTREALESLIAAGDNRVALIKLLNETVLGDGRPADQSLEDWYREKTRAWNQLPRGWRGRNLLVLRPSDDQKFLAELSSLQQTLRGDGHSPSVIDNLGPVRNAVDGLETAAREPSGDLFYEIGRLIESLSEWPDRVEDADKMRQLDRVLSEFLRSRDSGGYSAKAITQYLENPWMRAPWLSRRLACQMLWPIVVGERDLLSSTGADWAALAAVALGGGLYWRFGLAVALALLLPLIVAILFSWYSTVRRFNRYESLQSIHQELCDGVYDAEEVVRRLHELEKKGLVVPTVLFALIREVNPTSTTSTRLVVDSEGR